MALDLAARLIEAVNDPQCGFEDRHERAIRAVLDEVSTSQPVESTLLEAIPAMTCALCLYEPQSEGLARAAITVVEGYASCEHHLAFVAQGQTFAAILNAMKRERR